VPRTSDTSGSRAGSRVHVPDQEVGVLKTLFVGLCALVLVTQASAEANRAQTTDARTVKQQHRVATLQSRLEHKLAVARKQRSVIRFFQNHRFLLSSKEHTAVARPALVRATRGFAKTTRGIVALRRAIRLREARLRVAHSPRRVICGVFRRHCQEAVAVAWCESRLSTSAHNGEYLGLFQMSSLARELFGHGSTARQQALAAHRYFVSSGRDWSPWSCKPRSA
jgi:hypothetical protein